MRDGGEPRWVRILALGAPLFLAAFGAFGLLLADLGIYRPWLVLILGFLGFAVLYKFTVPLLAPEASPEVAPSRSGRICALLAVAGSAISAWWNFSNAAQHVQINRDGGLYLNAGKWIATHGTLNVQPYAGPFAHNPAVIATSTGMQQRGGHLEFNLSHMLSAILAEAQNLGGNRLMFAAVPILSGFALLAFYRLATRLLQQPVAALGATATLALIMPQVSFSRDSTTEIPIQVLLFTALWMLCDRRTLRAPRIAFVAGLLLGLVQAMHVDGLAFIIGLPVVYALTWLHTNRAGRKHVKAGILWSAIGVGVGVLLGALDLLRWDRSYLSVMQSNIAGLAVVLILAVAVSVGVVLLIRRTGLFGVVTRARGIAAYVAGGLVVIAGVGAWFVRPHIQHVRGSASTMVGFVQRINQLPVDTTRRYAELSVRWMSWYVGPITMALAIVGAAGLAVALVRGSLRLPVRIATFMLAPPALLYTLRPSIAPDQIWATRRFLPAVFPVIILLAWAVICVIARAETTSLRRSFAIVIGLATIIVPVLTIRDVSKMTEQRGLFPVITKTCKIIGPRSAVIVLQQQSPKSVAYLSDPQTLRSFCNVPVVVAAPGARAPTIRTLAARWREEGRQLFVVDEHAQAIKQLFPKANVRSTGHHSDPHILEQTLTRIPSKYAPEPLQVTIVHELAAAPVPLPSKG